MKLKQLIAKLETFDEDIEVVVEGYEFGYTDEIFLEYVGLNLNVNDCPVAGPHGDGNEIIALCILRDEPIDNLDKK